MASTGMAPAEGEPSSTGLPRAGTSAARTGFLVAALALVVFLPGLGRRSLWFPDEPDVAEPAMTMLKTGDWTVPRHNDDPWLDYPPLLYWAGAASSRLLGGASPFALRLPNALAAALMAGLCAHVAQSCFGGRAGLWSGLALLTAPQFVMQAINYHPDMFFALGQAGGIAAYARGLLGSREKGGLRASIAWRVAGFACFGLAILSKGPLGLLLPGLVLTLWHLTLIAAPTNELSGSARFTSMLAMGPLALVGLAVALPWYLAANSALGDNMVWRELYLQNFDRFRHGARGHEHPWPYYLSRIWGDWAPWCLLIPTALVGAIKSGWRDVRVRLLAIWFLTFFLFLTFATTKRSVYLLPAYPALAVLLGWHLDTLLRSARARFLGVPLVALGVSLALFGLTLPFLRAIPRERLARKADLASADVVLQKLALPLVPLALVLVICGGAILAFVRRRELERAVVALAGGLAFTYGWVSLAIAPHVDEVRSYGPPTRWLRESSGTEPIGLYLPGAEIKRSGFRVHDPAFLPVRDLGDAGDVLAWLSRPDHVAVCATARYDGLIAAEPRLAEIPHRQLFRHDDRFQVLGRAAGEAAE